MNLNFSFFTKQQEDFFHSRRRNNVFSGGFGNGKSYIGCLKLFVNLVTFPKYRAMIARFRYTDLRETTMKTFFKICPEEFVDSHNVQQGVTTLKNGSSILWSHLDAFDENKLRGLEINSVMVDQGEEIEEKIFLVLDARVGRWDQAEVPQKLLDEYLVKTKKEWPKDGRGKYIVPNFIDLLVNPDTTYHWIYKKGHPDSSVRDPDWGWFHGETVMEMNDPKTIEQMMKRDPTWVARYIRGEWGASSAQIHYIAPKSLIELNANEATDFLKTLRSKAVLFRSYDHGEAAPSCCLWCAYYRGVYIFYREYYIANQVISTHRQNIADLSDGEEYQGNYADPAIFRRGSQKDGGFWSIADEYITADLKSPPIHWSAADNNEFATRNRINELLVDSTEFTHPITGVTPSPGIYFIKKSGMHNLGCYNAIEQTIAQRREIISSENGKPIFSDERDEKVPDHAYDPVRYMIAMHSKGVRGNRILIPQRSFENLKPKQWRGSIGRFKSGRGL